MGAFCGAKNDIFDWIIMGESTEYWLVIGFHEFSTHFGPFCNKEVLASLAAVLMCSAKLSRNF
jgi:hypothetical protein